MKKLMERIWRWLGRHLDEWQGCPGCCPDCGIRKGPPIVVVALCLMASIAGAQVPLQPDWSNPGRVYGPVDAVPSLWQATQAAPVERSPNPRRMRMGVYSGGLTPLSAGVDLAVYPTVRVDIEAPISSHPAGPALHVTLDVGGLPGETLAIEDPSTFRSVGLEVGLSQPIKPSVFYPRVYLGAGFASRLPGDREPRNRAPRFALVGVQFQTDSRKARFVLGIGGDQRISTSTHSATWEPAVQIMGHAVLRTFKVPGTKTRASVMLVGDASLHVQMYQRAVGDPRPRDFYRLGIVIGGRS